MAIRFVTGAPVIKWIAQAPFAYMPRFGEIYIKWMTQAPEIAD